jgi:hypothetical protein
MASSIQATKLDSGQIGTTVNDDINYSSLAESFSSAIKAGMTSAEDNATEITKDQDAIQKIWDENNQLASTNGDYLNQRVVKLAEEGSLQLHELGKMYAKGKVTRNKYLTQKNNILNSAKQLSTFIKGYQDMRDKGLKAAAPGSLNKDTGLSIGSTLNTYNQDKLGAAAQLENHGFFLSNDGKIFFEQYDQQGNPSNNLNNFKTMPGALNASIQEYQNIDLTKKVKSVTAGVKPFMRVVGTGRIKTKKDAYKEKVVQDYVNNEWEGLKDDTEHMMSIITTQGVAAPSDGKWNVTEDPKEAAANNNLILVRIDPKTNRFVAVQKDDDISQYLNSYTQTELDKAMGNYEDGVAKAEVVFTNAVQAGLGIEETYKAPASQQKWQWEAGKDKENKLNTINVINKFFRGTEGDYASAVKSLQNAVVITGVGGDKTQVKLVDLIRPKTGGVVTMIKEITTFDENGNKNKPKQMTDKVDMAEMNNHQFIDAYYTFMYGQPPDQSSVSSLTLEPKFGPSKKQHRSTSQSIQSKAYADLPNVKFNDFDISPSQTFDTSVEAAATKVKLDSYNAIVQGGLDTDIDFSGYVLEPATNRIKFTYNGNEYYIMGEEKDGKISINGGQMETIYRMMSNDGELRGTYIYDKFGSPLTK